MSSEFDVWRGIRGFRWSGAVGVGEGVNPGYRGKSGGLGGREG